MPPFYKPASLLVALLLVCANCTTTADDVASAEPLVGATIEVAPTVETEPTAVPTEAVVPTVTGGSSANEALVLERLANVLLGADAGNLGDAELACFVDGAGPDAEAVTSAETEDGFEALSPTTRLAVMASLIECSPQINATQIADGYSAGLGSDLPPEAGECLAGAIASSPDRSAVVAGLAATRLGQGAPQASIEATTDVLVDCIGRYWVRVAIDEDIASNPEFFGAADFDCLATGTVDGELMRPLIAALVTDPDNVDDLGPLADRGVLELVMGCVSFGQLAATQAADAGVELSPESIECIDVTIAESGLASEIAAGQTDQTAINEVILGCMSEDELEASGAG